MLDPPLEKIGPPGKVTVEWFFTSLEERSRTFAWKAGSIGVFNWTKSIKTAGEDGVWLIMRSATTPMLFTGSPKPRTRETRWRSRTSASAPTHVRMSVKHLANLSRKKHGHRKARPPEDAE